MVKRLSGNTIAGALENAACDIVDGRFFQVSGVMFSIDALAPVGARIHGLYLAPPGHHLNACIGDPTQTQSPAPPLKVLLRAEETYTVAMVAFIAEGFDGYTLSETYSVSLTRKGP